MLPQDRPGIRFISLGEAQHLQSAQPRDVGALALVVGLFLILFVVSVMIGAPIR
jgi:hypothetical protein